MKLLKFITSLFRNQNATVDDFEISEEVKKQNWDIKYNDLGIFSYNLDGFEIDLKNQFHSIKWTDVERVSAYKADLITTDEICLDIIYDGKTIIITEETKGWYQFIMKLKASLPLINENWEAEVVKQTFEYNLTTIYERFDRKMPIASNFYSFIKGKTKEELVYVFQKYGWTIRKSSLKDYEFQNSWTELVLEEDNEGLSLHGLVAYHFNNVNIIREIFDTLHCTYKLEFLRPESRNRL